ncbi:MAG: transcriptional regulator [Aminipila sp.]
MRAFLEYRMKVEHVSKQDIQTLIGVSEKTLRNKLMGLTDFTWSEAKKIKNEFFPRDDYDELFSVTTDNQTKAG